MSYSARKGVIITGGTGKIGRRLVERMAALGYDVFFQYHEATEVAQKLSDFVKRKFEVKCLGYRSDFQELPRISAVIEQGFAFLSSCALYIHAASLFEKSSFEEATVAAIEANFALHVHAPWLLAQEFVKQCETRKVERSHPQIIHLIDAAVSRSYMNHTFFTYLMSKKALGLLTTMMSETLQKKGVRVNAICPGLVVDEGEHRAFFEKQAVDQNQSIQAVLQATVDLLENQNANGEFIYL